MWVSDSGGLKNEAPTALALSPDEEHVYMTGYFESDVCTFSQRMAAYKQQVVLRATGQADAFLLKSAAVRGVPQWAVSAGGEGYDAGLGVAADRAGDVYIAGEFTSNATFGDQALAGFNGGGDAFIMKVNCLKEAWWGTSRTNKYQTGSMELE